MPYLLLYDQQCFLHQRLLGVHLGGECGGGEEGGKGALRRQQTARLVRTRKLLATRVMTAACSEPAHLYGGRADRLCLETPLLAVLLSQLRPLLSNQRISLTEVCRGREGEAHTSSGCLSPVLMPTLFLTYPEKKTLYPLSRLIFLVRGSPSLPWTVICRETQRHREEQRMAAAAAAHPRKVCAGPWKNSSFTLPLHYFSSNPVLHEWTPASNTGAAPQSPTPTFTLSTLVPISLAHLCISSVLRRCVDVMPYSSK